MPCHGSAASYPPDFATTCVCALQKMDESMAQARKVSMFGVCCCPAYMLCAAKVCWHLLVRSCMAGKRGLQLACAHDLAANLCVILVAPSAFSVWLQLSAENDDLKRRVESLQAENTAISTAAEHGQKAAASEAAAAASTDAQQARLALQAAQKQQVKAQELLRDALGQLEEEQKSRAQEQAELER